MTAVDLRTAKTAFEAGDYIAALTSLSAVIDTTQDAPVLLLLADTFEKLGLASDAADLAARAVDLGNPAPETLKRAAELHAALGDEERAQLYGMKHVEQVPDDIDVAALLAASFLRTGERHLAEIVRAPLALSDDPAHILLAGDLFSEESRDPAALTVFRKLAALHPDDPYTLFKFMAVARDFCDYEAIEAVENTLSDALRDGTPSVMAGEMCYSNLLHSGSERVNRNATNSKTHIPDLSPLLSRQRRMRPHPWGEKIRIGYLSNDFWEQHATMRLLQSVIEAHDRSRFDITLYCYTPEKLAAADTGGRDRWGRIVPINHLSDPQAADAIRRDDIDILVDLKGHTGGSRSGILNLGVAPVQVAWLGYPGSVTGIDSDYVIGDPIVLPQSSRPFYHEQACRLPETYQPNDPVHRDLPQAASRAALGLPEDRFVFAAFNAARKISLDTLDAWAEILKAAPASLLWVMIEGDLARGNFLAALARRGVSAERILFAPKTRYDAHIARLQAADLGLDTFPYNGHTTTSDQLWAGLPVITLKGTNFASRVSESLLTAIGLPDLVLPDRQAFIARAAALANDPLSVQGYKDTLARNRFTAPLFDAERFCRHLEAAYGTMAERAREKLPPAPFDVPALPVRTRAFR